MVLRWLPEEHRHGGGHETMTEFQAKVLASMRQNTLHERPAAIAKRLNTSPAAVGRALNAMGWQKTVDRRWYEDRHAYGGGYMVFNAREGA